MPTPLRYILPSNDVIYENPFYPAEAQSAWHLKWTNVSRAHIAMNPALRAHKHTHIHAIRKLSPLGFPGSKVYKPYLILDTSFVCWVVLTTERFDYICLSNRRNIYAFEILTNEFSSQISYAFSNNLSAIDLILSTSVDRHQNQTYIVYKLKTIFDSNCAQLKQVPLIVNNIYIVVRTAAARALCIRNKTQISSGMYILVYIWYVACLVAQGIYYTC